MVNYSRQDPDILDNSTIDGGNFAQLVPNTEIMVGKTLTINGGNFTNVKKQSTWTINGGNWTQIGRCSNLHPYWAGDFDVPCGIECKHMLSKEDIMIDGTYLDTVYVYEDTKI